MSFCSYSSHDEHGRREDDPGVSPHLTLHYNRLPESAIAPFLTDLAARVKAEGIKVGSYPAFQKGVTISLIGQDVDAVRKYGQEVRLPKRALSPLRSLLSAHLFSTDVDTRSSKSSMGLRLNWELTRSRDQIGRVPVSLRCAVYKSANTRPLGPAHAYVVVSLLGGKVHTNRSDELTRYSTPFSPAR